MSAFDEFLPVPGIAGLDGVVPVYAPNARWCIWDKNEIYTGAQGNKRYVPKINDWVIDRDYKVWYEVVLIDPVTYVAVLKELDMHNTGGELTDVDLLLGVGPGTQADTYRIYIDKSTMPYTLCVDARLHVAGVLCSTAKIFRGSDLTMDANVISKVFDGSGNYLGQSVPLELVAMDGNQSIKVVPVCYTTDDIPDNEVLTVVLYSTSGGVVSKRQCLAENTAFIRTSNDAVKYITDISLKSPFLSETDPSKLIYPINVPLAGLFLTGVVTYSDGSQTELPVDGTKFQAFGLENFIATIPGQTSDLVLKYNLSTEEVCYIAQAVDPSKRFITKDYESKVAKADGAYTVKLFGYPHWIDGVNGYRMEWFLYNLERNRHERVTPYVRTNGNSPIFDPLLFNARQRLNVALNLQDVSSEFKYYRHVQTIDITLMGPGGEDGTNWMVGFDPTQNPQYGVENKFQYVFVNQNLKQLKVDMGLADQAEWLQRLYYTAKPLVNPYNESVPIVPDFFAVVVGNERVMYQLSEWHNVLSVSDQLWHGATVFIEFIKRTAAEDLLLAVAGVPVKQLTAWN